VAKVHTLPFARSEYRRTPVSALGLIVGSVMGPINPAKMGVRTTIKGKDCSYLGLGDYSPEKAGVGGSTPSLATIFSITYKRSKVQSCHTLSHKIQSCSESASNILHSDRVDKIRNCNQ
jgi:hypothetical protein